MKKITSLMVVGLLAATSWAETITNTPPAVPRMVQALATSEGVPLDIYFTTADGQPFKGVTVIQGPVAWNVDNTNQVKLVPTPGNVAEVRVVSLQPTALVSATVRSVFTITYQNGPTVPTTFTTTTYVTIAPDTVPTGAIAVPPGPGPWTVTK